MIECHFPEKLFPAVHFYPITTQKHTHTHQPFWFWIFYDYFSYLKLLSEPVLLFLWGFLPPLLVILLFFSYK